MKILRNVLIVAVVLLLGSIAAGSWLLAPEEIPLQSDYAIDLVEIRKLARSLPGSLPERINHEHIATAGLPRAALFAGESFDNHPMVHGAYQIVYPDGIGIVDAAMGREFFEADMASVPGALYRDRGWQVLTRALEQARFVVLTHEHGDHINGIVVHPNPDKIAGHVRLNSEQLADPQIDDTLRAKLEPLVYDRHHAIAPGVVLIRAAGHTPGSQMVFVTTRTGEEWLLLGDVAWHMDQIEELHYRPRLVTDLFLGEDRAAVMAQFRTLHNLMSQEPNLQLVASHDLDLLHELVSGGRMGGSFE